MSKLLLHVGVGVIVGTGLVQAACAEDDPAAVAKAFYEALNAGAYEKIEKMKSATTLANDTVSPPAIRTVRASAGKAVTRGSTITEVEVLGKRVQGSRAWVDVRLNYKDGTSQKFNAGLVHEEGSWKITDD
jgi:hypothetical protein